MMFVSIEQAQDHLRAYDVEDENDITLKIHAASGAVRNYLGSYVDTFLDTAGDVIVDSSGVPEVPYEVQIATLILVGIFYKDRDGDPDKNYTPGYLPAPVTALLYPLRDPVVV